MEDKPPAKGHKPNSHLFSLNLNRSKLLEIKIKLHSDLVCPRGIHSLKLIDNKHITSGTM